MARFQDLKTAITLADSRRKISTFGEYAENVHEYAASDDSATEAFERAYFADKDFEADKEMLETSSEEILLLESELLPVLAKMESDGVWISKDELSEIAEELRNKAKNLELEMTDLVGEPFNPNSAKQVQHVLFEKLNIPSGKKIKTGFSVDSDTLSEIGKNYEIANMILEYRTYEKLRSTYAEGLTKDIAEDGRVRTTYNQFGAATGRLSSEAPNLQNIPSGEGYPSRIKSCFRPKEGNWKYLVADYSQIELRVLAFLSQDEALLGAFRDGRDIHAETAKFLFPTAKDISKDMRRVAKTVNFGVIYGITGFGLSKTVGTSPAEATGYIEAFFSRYSGVRAYYDALLEKARATGYVETALGRKRFVKGLNDANQNIRKGAEREAMNMPVQGTAADVVKRSMVRLPDDLKASGLQSRMIMQVHDELVFEGPETEMADLEKIVRNAMENALPGCVLPVDVGTGTNWSEAK